MKSNKKLINGKPFSIKSLSRRGFIRSVGVIGMGTLALREYVSKTYGIERDGVPIVHTYDKYGVPDKIRIVSKERYRRLLVYNNIDFEQFKQKHPAVEKISVKRRSNDPDDLAIELYVNESNEKARETLPKNIQDTPVVYKESSMNKSFKCQDPDRNCRTGRHYDWMKSNEQISAQGTGVFGTLGIVAWNNDSSNPYKCIITAWHVTEDHNYQYIHQPASNYSSSRKVGVHRSHSNDLDAVKYKVTNGIIAKPRITTSPAQPDITGYWGWIGLTDATEYGTVPCSYAGAETCYIENVCDNTATGNLVTRQADMKYERTEKGDSGGPYVDDNGKLVCILNGCEAVIPNDFYDVGAVAGPVLSNLNAQLYKP